MEKNIDKFYDKKLLNIYSLTWLPWIGKDFRNNKRKLLIVGESHYNEKNDVEYSGAFQRIARDKDFTRKCVFESAVCSKWSNKIFDNTIRLSLRHTLCNKIDFWQQVVYYNFIQRLIDYRIKERPTSFDFYASWEPFIKLIKILKPTDCVFIGVSASDSFSQAMEKLKISHIQVKRQEKIGTTYAGLHI